MNHECPITGVFHGTCLDLAGTGILILGPSGAGKSDLALRLLDQPGCGVNGQPKPAMLVADDQVILTLESGRLLARSPPALRGLLEIRGLGIVELPFRPQAALGLVVTLSDTPEIERMPEPGDLSCEILGTSLPMFRLDPRTASAPARVRAAVDSLSVKEPIVISTPQR
jgi:serine kinase of HPr protein (carbohydrate metabolism regulator)